MQTRKKEKKGKGNVASLSLPGKEEKRGKHTGVMSKGHLYLKKERPTLLIFCIGGKKKGSK